MSDHSHHSSRVHGRTRDPEEECNLIEAVRRLKENAKQKDKKKKWMK